MNRKNIGHYEGNLTKSPNMYSFTRKDKEGNDRQVSVCNITIAIDGGRTGHDDEVCFLDCELWDSAAEAMSEYRKGDVIHVEGNLKNKEYVDKVTNEKRHKLVLRCEHFIPVYIKEGEASPEPLSHR